MTISGADDAATLTLTDTAGPFSAAAALSQLRYPPREAWRLNAAEINAAQPWNWKNGSLHLNPTPLGAARQSGKIQLRIKASADFESARQMLQAGEIQVLERIAPWQISALRADRQLAVEPYAVKAMHLLLFNQRSAALETPLRREALCAAINRARLLAKLSRGQSLAESGVANWIWPQANPASAIAATSARLPVPAPELAQLLWNLDEAAAGQASALAARSAEPLSMAIPCDPTARLTAQEIVDQGRQAGIAIEIRTSNQPYLPDRKLAEECDLVYWIWHPVDPLADCADLLFRARIMPLPGGAAKAVWNRMLKESSATRLSAQLRELEALLLARRLALPLFQLTEFSARQVQVQGSGTLPVDLFQHAVQWKMTPR
jgi:ABC-type transport system substrate-binding protein